MPNSGNTQNNPIEGILSTDFHVVSDTSIRPEPVSLSTQAKRYFHQYFGSAFIWVTIFLSSPFIFRPYPEPKEATCRTSNPKVSRAPSPEEEPDSSAVVDDDDDVQLKPDYEGLYGARELISYLGFRVLEIKVDNPFLESVPVSSVVSASMCDGESTCAQVGSVINQSVGPIEEAAQAKFGMKDVCNFADFVEDLNARGRGHRRSSKDQSSFAAVVADERAASVDDPVELAPLDDSIYCTDKIPIVRLPRSTIQAVIVDRNVQPTYTVENIEDCPVIPDELSVSLSAVLYEYFGSEVSREFDEFLKDMEVPGFEDESSDDPFQLSAAAYMAYKRSPYAWEEVISFIESPSHNAWEYSWNCGPIDSIYYSRDGDWDQEEENIGEGAPLELVSLKLSDTLVVIRSKQIAFALPEDDSDIYDEPSSSPSGFLDQFFTSETLREFENDMDKLLADLSEDEEEVSA
ncbi:hypothetical protein CVT25_004419 [Psilocybe cyanescens]|uniref:Uncharacterized protein n=1 Tax=Psilocybe cyanescens TaxID=93625 RepID=A0A409XW06_PSICY|nr:hypothetical protein CVT25_004419 [Psilocybe cyanescens]